MHVEGNRSSGTSRNYRANAALPPRSVLIHLHALLPPPHYGARSLRPSLSVAVGNECASPAAAAAGYEIMVKFDRLAAVARAGQTATPRRRGKERYGWMGWGRRGEGEHSFTSPFPRTLRTDPAPPPAPELVYLPGQNHPGRLLARELIWSQKSALPPLPHLQLSARDF